MTAKTPSPARYTPHALHRQLRLDALLRRGLLATLALAVVALLWVAGEDGVVSVAGLPVNATLLVVVLLVVPWLPVNVVNAQAARALGQAAALLDRDLPAAERALLDGLGRWPLRRWTRLQLYQRLGVVRHRQQRFAESAALAAAVLAHGVDRRMGPHAHSGLLLQLTEASLAGGDAVTAFYALAELHGHALPLPEQVQRLLLQLRYEAAVGAWEALRWNWRGKAQLAELLPAPLGATAHALLAQGARRCGDRAAAQWLHRRSRLLGGRS